MRVESSFKKGFVYLLLASVPIIFSTLYGQLMESNIGGFKDYGTFGSSMSLWLIILIPVLITIYYIALIAFATKSGLLKWNIKHASFLLILVLMVVYKGGSFTVTLDPNFSLDSGLVMYESIDTKDIKNRLYAKDIEFMDNISVNWLPSNINNEGDGTHNGENYIAYTFYLENQGTEIINYWYQVNILDVIKNVDEAIRVMIYRNNERIIYAKKNSLTGLEENGTVSFHSDDMAVLEQRKSFRPGDIDKLC